MALRRSNDVFLLTLVDFLIQVIFFSLFIFVIYQSLINDPKAKKFDNEKVAKAIEAAGVSDLTELVDELSKLAPVRLKGFNDSLGDDMEQGDVAKLAEAFKKLGGGAKLPSAMSRLEKLEQGSDKPPCIFEILNGQRRAKSLASAIGSGSTITFVSNTPELNTLLNSIGLKYENIRALSLQSFKRTFTPVLLKQPNCRYTLNFRETSRMVDARDAANQIFYLRLSR